MQKFEIADALKGFVLLGDETMELAFDRIVRSITVPLLRPAEEVIANCIERERGISGCTDKGLVIADLSPKEGFASELILALGVYTRGILWRANEDHSYRGPRDLMAHFVLVILDPDDISRMRALRAASWLFIPDCEPGRSILGATTLEQAVEGIRAFEEAEF